MAKEFYNKLINYVSVNDTKNANNLLMQEVGKSLVKNKSNFIELLTASGVPASESMSDIELVDSFVNALPNNKSLMIGTAYMINADNSFVGVDGTEQISDKGVKVCYNVMYDFFNCEDSNEREFRNADGEAEEYSNIPGLGQAIAGVLGGATALGTKALEGKQKKEFGASEALAQKQQARQQMVQAIMAERQAKLDAENKKREVKAKQKKTLLIIGSAVIGLAIIGLVIYKIKKK